MNASPKPIAAKDWKLEGAGHMSDAQRRLLNAVCADLGDQLIWIGGIRLSHDDYRHMVSGTIMGWRTMPGIVRYGEPRGWIMLGGSSLKLTRSEATDAITLAVHMGDHPEEQELPCKRVQWCPIVLAALGVSGADDRDAERFAV